MENVLKYFGFSEFFRDTSAAFSGHEICYTELNATHFLIFEKNITSLNLYASRFTNKKDIGVQRPEILELVVKDYDKSIPAHRVALRKYLS